MTLCNMVIEAGGKNGVVPADATTTKYLEGKTSKPYQVFTSDGNARYVTLQPSFVQLLVNNPCCESNFLLSLHPPSKCKISLFLAHL